MLLVRVVRGKWVGGRFEKVVKVVGAEEEGEGGEGKKDRGGDGVWCY